MSAADYLIERCRETSFFIEEAAGWVADEANVALVGREREPLLRALRRGAIRANRLEKAVSRPMCVGVFGPSQAGKSYLVEVLARPESGPLKAHFDGHDPVDFLSEINPIGEKESTGLVTRFTARRASEPAPAGFPVRLRLLSEMDAVKILGNTYFFDGDQTKEAIPAPEEIAETLARLRNQAGPVGGSVSEDDIIDLQDYFQKHFAGMRLLDVLSRYWEEARDLARRLDVRGRAELFAFLWGRHRPMTDLFVSLATALDALGRPDEIFAPIHALIPREGSILDVATLAGLGSNEGERLEVRAPRGQKLDLPRPLLAALTAELRIELADDGRALFKETDLLDFPGARSRQKIGLSTFFEENTDALKETFLRGKVAYLFDRYVAEQELTSMILCVRPSNQEVATLPDLVDDWIAHTHGRSPQDRAGQPNLLFFVMTWFDTHFVDRAGDAGHSPGARFKARMEASLLGFFGKAHSWPRNWTRGQPFQNCYWFRNPNYPAESIIRYDGRRELEFLPEKVQRIAELKAGFAELAEANEHFRDPARAFDEALRLNDGGISYLAENIATVCRVELKLGQVRGRLEDLRRDMRGLVAKFHIDLDIDKRLKERREAADRVFDMLEPVVDANAFGAFLSNFLVDPGELTDIVYATLRGGAVGRNGSVPTGAAQPQAAARVNRPSLARPGGRSAVRETAPAQEVAPPAPKPASTAREYVLARACIDAWVERLTRLVEDEAVQRRFGVARDPLKDIVDEKLGLIRRIDLEQVIANDIRLHTVVESAESASPKIALIGAKRINALVGDLGFGRMPEARRPEVEANGVQRRAFAERPIVHQALGIGAERIDHAAGFATDWFFGFMKVVEDNAQEVGAVKVDLQMNARLKTIIDTLGAAIDG